MIGWRIKPDFFDNLRAIVLGESSSSILIRSSPVNYLYCTGIGLPRAWGKQSDKSFINIQPDMILDLWHNYRFTGILPVLDCLFTRGLLKSWWRHTIQVRSHHFHPKNFGKFRHHDRPDAIDLNSRYKLL